ncbi:glycosyltransferase family 4 protein [Riemerella anatipestifer]|uniref:glycosyltransferase family 4 protein n=1 Tax=Riemerella anatipestifer TaxID=34085 RepID=UPI001373074B|nr:glycosyltransferase family 4 protein [Riemerella anatipestifer]MBT0549767.1 glycosyltransferase family 4 protein [Riemerella anatipestifer]MBT0556008.1 glycosyltransferase family 4 protein [Riemerella anatipestifer]MBT0560530.1 glycosyltransferase family 4 protein [Riemerella anatipestifer]NAV16447.1 glycosyltransferase WbuB [Riemerella anatipestifer]UZX28340.1 glycosyltransferase family 4 protein [Riemerella anatipestifer]
MKILLLHQYFLEEDDPGGSRWNEMSKTWVSLGHEVTVLAGMVHANGSEKRSEYKGKLFVKKKQGDVNVVRCHVSEAYNKGFVGRLWGYFSFMFSCLWAGFFKVNDRFDVIIVTSPPLFVGVSGYILSLFKRIPMVFEVRDLWPESAIDTGVLNNKWIIKLAYAVERFIYKKSKLINVLTPAFYKILNKEKGIPKEKLVMIPNAADFSLSEVIMETFDRDVFRKEEELEDKFVITYVGAHGVANHLEQILEVGKTMEDTNVLFLLIGQGMQKEYLVNKAKEMQVKNVRFVEPKPKAEVFKYILASEMGASVLMKNDTFKTVYSNKTFDYFSCKKPVLMAIDGVSRELVEKAQAGTFVEPENIEQYDGAIRHYLANPNLLEVQGENGYRYAKENFDRIKLAISFIDSIESIVT